MNVNLNGEPTEVPEAATITQLVELTGAGADQRGLAVAAAGEVVPRSAGEGMPTMAPPRFPHTRLLVTARCSPHASRADPLAKQFDVNFDARKRRLTNHRRVCCANAFNE